MKHPYESPSVQAIRLAEEPMRGFVFTSTWVKDNRKVAGADGLLSYTGETGTDIAMDKKSPYRKK